MHKGTETHITPALDSPEAIQRGASLGLFILDCKTFATSLEDCSNAKIVGDPKVSDCLPKNLYFMEVGDVQFYPKNICQRVKQG